MTERCILGEERALHHTPLDSCPYQLGCYYQLGWTVALVESQSLSLRV